MTRPYKFLYLTFTVLGAKAETGCISEFLEFLVVKILSSFFTFTQTCRGILSLPSGIAAVGERGGMMARSGAGERGGAGLPGLKDPRRILKYLETLSPRDCDSAGLSSLCCTLIWIRPFLLIIVLILEFNLDDLQIGVFF